MICACGSLVEKERIELLNATTCSVCARRIRIDRKCGILVWHHKTAPELQLTSSQGHRDFRKATDRIGQKSILRRISGCGR